MKLYECVFVARQDLATSQVETMMSNFTTTITEMGGKIEKTENCGLRQLAYRIRKNKKGHYCIIYFTANGDAVAELERKMRVNEDVLRNLTVTTDKVPTGSSVLSFTKGFRDNRRREEGGYQRSPSGRSMHSSEDGADIEENDMDMSIEVEPKGEAV